MGDHLQGHGEHMTKSEPIKTQALYRRCDPALIDFDTSDQAPQVGGLFGQRRVVDALEFGVAMARPGYNLFVISEPEGDSQQAVRRLLEARTAAMAVPGDWCYVYNFDNPQQPQLIPLLPGSGVGLRRDMLRFTEELYSVIEAALDSDDFRTRVEAIQTELKERREKALRELGDESASQGIALLRTEGGFVFSPLKGDEPMPPDAFAELSDEEKERFARAINEFGERMQKLSYQFLRWHRDMQARLRQLGRETVHLAVGHLIDELKERHAAQPKVLAFLDRVLADVVEYGEALRDKRAGAEGAELAGEGLSVQRYQVNLLVDHSAEDVAPIVFESNPTFPNLVGRLDYVAHMGTWVTNFTLIRPGALQRANGGFLMLDAIKVLSQPYAWDCLKRALKLGHIQIESLGQALGFATNLALEPEPMPLQCKVVMFGEPRLYFLLKEFDPEFDELFKVAADFERDLERSDANTRSYACELAGIARRSGMRPFERRAVARLIEHSARLAGDAERLSMATRRLTDLMDEANHHAGQRGGSTVSIDDVEAALKSQVRRLDRFRDRYQEAILRGTFLIDSAGTHVGQINGLA
ncbi:MAG TPA: ATP-binding protein, partial [Rhodocyclaceae bacterium]|nr:ATP-binding protein [Rhodocyclaceae bacterium]